MGLSATQQTAVSSSWAKASAAWGNDGPEFYLTLFKEVPDTFPFFKELFKGKDVSAVKGTPELAAQSAAFKGLIDAWVKTIDADNALNGLCATFAKKHSDRGISEAQIKATFDCLVRFCGQRYGADEGAWKAVVDVLMSKIGAAM